MRYLVGVGPSIVLLTAALPALAGQRTSGKEVLAQMDRALTRARDQIMDWEMVIEDRGRSPRRIGLQVHVRGTERRLVEFRYPGDVKGMKILILSRDKMYVYLPAFRKIRRIAGHVRAQSMFGADYNYDDIATVTYSDVFAGKLVEQNATHWIVDARRRPGKQSPYARIRFQVRKDNKLPDQLIYFDDNGKRIKTEQRSDFSCNKGMCAAATMKMVDHRRADHWTKMVRKGWQVDTDFSERLFSLRRLQRAE